MGGADDAARRDSGSVGYAGDHPHHLRGPGAADRRGPGHVSADDDDAVGPGCEGGAGLLVLRRFVRLRDLRGRHRPVLGALARARVPQPGAGPPAGGGEAVARSRCDRRGLDLRIRARRPRWRTRPRAAARAAGLVPQVRTEGIAERRRSRDRRRHGAAVPGRRRSGPAQGVQPAACQGDRLDPRRQSGSGRLGGRAGRGGVHGAHARLSQIARRFPHDTGAGLRGRHAGAPQGCRARPAWARNAPRDRRARRRGRSRRRHRRAALRQERVGDDPGGQGAARAAEARVAGRSRDRSRLRPLGADRARGRPSEGQARRGIRRRRARVPRVPAAFALGARRGSLAAARRAGGVRRDAHARGQRQHHVAGRHRDRDRRDGRRRDRDDRERAQEARGVEARAWRRAGGRRTVAGHHRSVGRGRPGAFLQPRHHHAVVRAGVHARSAGRPDVRAARLHQDLCDGRRRGSGGDAGAGADGLLRARAHPLGRRESAEPLPDRGLPPVAARSARLAEGDTGRRRACAGGDRLAGAAARRRVHAATGRGRSPLHADRAARTVGGQGRRAAAADRSPDQDGARGRGRVRQGGARGNGDRPGADGDDRDDDPVQAERSNGGRA